MPTAQRSRSSNANPNPRTRSSSDGKEETKQESKQETSAGESIRQPPSPPSGDGKHLTRSGNLDRRYNEHRDIPNYEKLGSHAGGTPRTKDGAPDRRFAQNRDLTEKEADIAWAKHILEQDGVSNKSQPQAAAKQESSVKQPPMPSRSSRTSHSNIRR